jgi:hypothetical protein
MTASLESAFVAAWPASSEHTLYRFRGDARRRASCITMLRHTEPGSRCRSRVPVAIVDFQPEQRLV